MDSQEVSRRRNGLLPSCEPCRKSKQACDHEQPICGRCARKPGTTCTYHPAPLTGLSNVQQAPKRIRKAKKLNGHSSSPSLQSSASTHIESSLKPKIRKDIYPDPGYLGSSSSSAVFEEIQGQISIHPSTAFEGFNKDEAARAELLGQSDSTKIKAGAELLATLCDPGNFQIFDNLLATWFKISRPCSVIHPFFDACFASIKTVTDQLKMIRGRNDDLMKISELILANTLQPFHFDGNTTFQEYVDQFSGDNLRWESVGLVFAVIGLAAINMHPTDHSFYAVCDKQQVCKSCLDSADACLACCDPERPNDVRVWLRFEIMILHSLYHGDSSFYTWSKLGDLTSEAFALGLHQDLKAGPSLPFFLAELRKRSFTMIYSQDKMLATYTGRPCRISRKFGILQMPLDLEDHVLKLSKEEIGPYLARLDKDGWCNEPPERASWYARASCLTSVVRESILELVLGPEETDTFGALAEDKSVEEKIRDARKLAHESWARMPAAFRYDLLTDNEKLSHTPGIINSYLEHLYNLFLIERFAVRRLKGSSTLLLSIAGDQLKVVLEAVNGRGKHSVIPGDLAWQVSAYGLPASGILALELLKQARQPTYQSTIPRSETIQSLSVLVSQLPVIIPAGEGNYALFAQSRKMLQAILDVVLSPPRIAQLQTPPSTDAFPLHAPDAHGLNGNDWSWFEQFDFNGEFWNNVADHPLLAPMDVLQ